MQLSDDSKTYYYRLTNDIDLSDEDIEGNIRVGDYHTIEVDGDNHNVLNLSFKYNEDPNNNCHFFLFDVNSDTTFKNMTFKNVDYNYTGPSSKKPSYYSIFGTVKGTLDNVNLSGNVTADFGADPSPDFAGLVEALYEGSIATNCTIDADFVLNTTAHQGATVGAFALNIQGATVSDYTFDGTIDVVRTNKATSNVSLLANQLSNSKVENAKIGGKIKSAARGYALANNASSYSYSAPDASIDISNVEVSAEICTESIASGLIGRTDGNSNNKNTISSCNITDKAILKSAACYGLIEQIGWSTDLEISECHNNADIDVSDIKNSRAIGLIGEIDASISTSKVVIKDCSNEGELIASSKACGLIDTIKEGVNSTVTISNCVNKGNLAAEEVAGLVYEIGDLSCFGKADDADSKYKNITIKNCSNECEKMEAKHFAAGGILYAYLGYIYNCINKADITFVGDYNHTEAGGIIYSISGGDERSKDKIVTIEKCSNEGEITNALIAGGVVCEMNCGRILNSNNKGNIKAQNMGGIVYYLIGGFISSAYNIGNLTYSCASDYHWSVYVGGIAAEVSGGSLTNDSIIYNCYNAGNIDIKAAASNGSVPYTGGIVGYCVHGNHDSYIVNCYSAGKVFAGASAKDHTGIVCGMLSGKYPDGEGCFLSGIYYLDSAAGDYEECGTNYYVSFRAKENDDTQMRKKEYFGAFDFNSVWTESADASYPYPMLKGCKNIFEMPRPTGKIIYSYGHKTVDVSAFMHRVDSAHGAFKLSVELDNVTNVKDYAICNANKEAIYVDTTGEFKEVSPKLLVLKEGDPNLKEPLYIRIRDKKDKAQYIKTCLYIELAKPPKLKQFKMDGANIGFSLSDDVPIFGGQDYALALPASIPVSVILEDGQVKVGINVTEGVLYSSDEHATTGKDSFKSLGTTASKTELEKKFNNWKDSIQKSKEIATEDLNGVLERIDYESQMPLWEKKVKLNVIGYAIGEYSSDSMTKLMGELYVEIVGSAEIEKETAVPVGVIAIPIYLDLNLSGSAALDTTGGYDFVADDWVFDVDLNFNFKADGYAAVGVGKFISVGPYGMLSTNIDTTIISRTKSLGLNEVGLKGAIGIRGYFAEQKLDDYEIVSMKVLSKIEKVAPYIDGDKLMIYSRTKESLVRNSKSGSKSAQKSAQKSVAATYAEYMADTDLLDESSQNGLDDICENVGAAGDDTIVTNCYPDASPKLVQIGDELMLIYIGVKEKDTALCYSIYDKDTQTFSEPKVIEDDGTSDYKFSVATAGDDLWICYQDSTEADTEELELSEYAKTFKISYAKYNKEADKFEVEGTVGAGNTYCFNPKATVIDDKLMLVWVENQTGNIFGMDGKNVIKSAVIEGGNATTTEIANDLNAVTSIAVGNIDNKPYIAYVELVNNDLDAAIRNIVLYDVNEKTIKKNSTKASFIDIVKLPSQKAEMLCANIDGGLAVFNNALSSTMVSDVGLFGSNDEFYVDGDTIYSISYPHDNVRDIECIKYTDGDYGKISLTNQAEYIESISAKDGILVYMSNDVDMSSYYDSRAESNIVTRGSIKVLKSLEKKALEADYLQFDGEQMTPSGTIDIGAMVTNGGTSKTEAIKGYLYDKKTDELVDAIDTGVTINPGQSKNIKMTAKLPAEISEDGYYVVFKSDDIESNKLEAEVKAEIEVASEYGASEDDRFINAYVSNIGGADAVVTTTIKDNNGNILGNHSDLIKAGKTQEYTLNILDENMPSDGESVWYVVEATTDSEEYYLQNNICEILVKPIDNTEIESAIVTDADDYRERAVALNKSVLNIGEGQNEKLSVTALDNYGKVDNNPNLRWKSDDTSVATVNDGVVKGIKTGRTTVYVDYNGKIASCVVNVIKKADDGKTPEKDKPEDTDKDKDKNDSEEKPSYLSEKEILADGSYLLNLATKQKLEIPEFKKTAADGKSYKIEFASKADKKLVSISKKGLIIAKKSGSANVIITKGETTYKVRIVIADPQFEAKKYTVKAGETITPKYDSCNLKTVFSIPDKQQKFATVDADTGEVKTKAKGNVTLTATIGEGKMARKVTTKIKILK